MDTMDKIRFKWRRDRSAGRDAHPRDFLQEGPTPYVELYRAATNAFLRGETPSVDADEWEGSILSLIPKICGAVEVKDNRPIARLCTKCITAYAAPSLRFRQVMEEYQLITDAQEGFRKNRSTKRQLAKLKWMSEDQQQRRCIVVQLDMDLANAFNAPNHRPIIQIIENYGFHPNDVAFLKRMLQNMWVSVGSEVGETAACVLSRGFWQGNTLSPDLFISILNPAHAMIEASGRGCSVTALQSPDGSSGYADDAQYRTDGPDAIPAMQVIVDKGAVFLDWIGMSVNMNKSGISAIDYATGKTVDTSSITLKGQTFPVIHPKQPTKTLGIRMSLTGDLSAEKQHVMDETARRVEAMITNQILTPCLKELTFKLGICSVFRYSAGLVPWTTSELNKLHALWLKAYKKSWGSDRGVDDAPFLLPAVEGGRGCPQPEEIWIEEVKTLYEQCLLIPGHISQLAIYQLQHVCQQHGCVTLDQTQRILRIQGRANTVEEWYLLRLDQRGLEMSSPWSIPEGTLVAETLWPYLQKIWKEKMKWLGCTEFSEELQQEWAHVQVCLKALKQLGRVGIFQISQLLSGGNQWKQWSDLRIKGWQLTETEYQSLLQRLDQLQAEEVPVPSEAQGDRVAHCLKPAPWQRMAHTGHDGRGSHEDGPAKKAKHWKLPAYLVGVHRAIAAHDCIELGYWRSSVDPNVEVQSLSDDHLAQELSKNRAVFVMHLDESQAVSVECLTPIRYIWPAYSGPAMMIVQKFDADGESNEMAILSIALIRDCFLAEGITHLRSACARPTWRVPRDALNMCFDLGRTMKQGQSDLAWHMLDQGNGGQQTLGRAWLGASQRRIQTLSNRTMSTQVWQMEKIPSNIHVDLTNHEPQQLPSPEHWEIWQRNARVVITKMDGPVATMCSAQYGMLLELSGVRNLELRPTIEVMEAICDSGLKQSRADMEYQVHWSRHLLACLKRITGAMLLVGARAVMFHPHFSHFISPEEKDVLLGAEENWPNVPAILILDSYPLTARSRILARASAHRNPVWILRQDATSHAAREDLIVLRQLQAQLVATLPNDSLVLHDQHCWSHAKWDSKPAKLITQVWRLGCGSTLEEPLLPQEFQQQLGDWAMRRYDFYWSDNPSRPLQLYRPHQQDACQYTWQGLVGASDGSADMKKEKMGTGFVVGLDRTPLLELAAQVGGPLAALRAESAGLLYLIRRVRDQFGEAEPVRLLVLVDCLVLLDILQKWGASEFYPDPRDIIHFDVIIQLLVEMRRWNGIIVLKKIKGHAGCMLNELADERADRGYAAEGPPLCQGPQKYGSLWLRIRPSLQTIADSEGITTSLPRNSAPDKLILRQVAALNTLRATASRSTIFVKTVLHQDESRTVRRVIRLCSNSAIRCWIKATCATYPTHTYLNRINHQILPWCPYCTGQVKETFTHFTAVCPQFREARTAAHNQLREIVSNWLQNQLAESGGWRLFEEVRMAQMGLRLRPVSADVVINAGRHMQLKADGMCDVGRLQPDLVALSWARRRIAIIDISRPSDSYIEQLQSAHDRKKNSYQPLLQALQEYTDNGWQIAIFPWVVGVRGLIIESHVKEVLGFLEIPSTAWKHIIEASVRTSVEGFAFLHQVRLSTPQARQTWRGLGRQGTGRQGENVASQAIGKQWREKWGGENLQELMLRWKNMTSARRRRNGARDSNWRAPPAPD